MGNALQLDMDFFYIHNLLTADSPSTTTKKNRHEPTRIVLIKSRRRFLLNHINIAWSDKVEMRKTVIDDEARMDVKT